MKRFGFLLLALIPISLFGGVLVIDPDTIPKNVINVSMPAQEVTVALVHFIPHEKSPATTPELPAGDGISGVCKALAKTGKVNLLYLATRSASQSADGTLLYNSLEQRPAFSLLANGQSAITNREFGLALRLRVISETNQQAQLAWDGNFSWSNDLIKLWAGDRYLTFGMSLVKILKPGAVFTEGGEDDDEPEQSGINLRALFSRKKKETPSPTAKEKQEAAAASFLNTDYHQIKLNGTRALSSGEVAIFNYESSSDPQVAETIYLLIETLPAR